MLLRSVWSVWLWWLAEKVTLAVGHSPETSMVKVSLLTPARLKATHSTVILRLDSPTVRTLSTSTAPNSSLCTSTVGAWRGMAICSPVLFPLHLPHCNTYTIRRPALANQLHWRQLTYDPGLLPLTLDVSQNTDTRWFWEQDIQRRCRWVWLYFPISPQQSVSLSVAAQ